MYLTPTQEKDRKIVLNKLDHFHIQSLQYASTTEISLWGFEDLESLLDFENIIYLLFPST